MLSIDPKETPTPELHQYLLGAVAPRPIAFVSTIDAEGRPNLAPYSFFNAFSSNPPTVVFSSNRRVRDNTTKDTLHNLEVNGEVVINVVNYAIVRQMTIASIEYDAEISEFEKAGLSPLKSDLVKPFRVAESPVQMECIVKDVISLGAHGGAGNLVICEIVRMHVNPEVLDEKGKIDPQKIDLMGRMGRAFYCRASGENVFPLFQPVTQIGMGFDELPSEIRNSKVLTGNDLGQLAGVEKLPTKEAVAGILEMPLCQEFIEAYGKSAKMEKKLHKLVRLELEKGNIDLAWKLLMLPLYNFC